MLVASKQPNQLQAYHTLLRATGLHQPLAPSFNLFPLNRAGPLFLLRVRSNSPCTAAPHPNTHLVVPNTYRFTFQTPVAIHY
jgi:hypothetical protein